MRTYFPELVLYQTLGYYNGGTLGQLFDRYHEARRAIPEGFIWHVFSTLVEAVRYLQTGAEPGIDVPSPKWNPIYHRDISMANIFLDYPPRLDTVPEPPMGFEGNAFPEIIIGDFGQAATEEDEYFLPGRWSAATLESWHDTYAIYCVVKTLLLAHIPEETLRENNIPQGIPFDEINNWMHHDNNPYSDELINTISLWDYPNCETFLVDDFQMGLDGDPVLNYQLIPKFWEIETLLLPRMRIRAEAFRRPPSNVPSDYYRGIDVSWTKPARLMPYEWVPEPYIFVDDEVEEDDNNQQDNNANVNNPDKNNQGGGDQNGEKENQEPSKPLVKHKCLEPNHHSDWDQMSTIQYLETQFPLYRPRHRRVVLQYRAPVASTHGQLPASFIGKFIVTSIRKFITAIIAATIAAATAAATAAGIATAATASTAAKA
ncbi:hypothetical protein NUW58_g2716 [Xylaria curta]|uniref:Uncharacterized protein n=1 Tax=Xylaria curta TaxID=42375 RepID=A0ACC1PGX9_9PEZI|nr:hypothetical protein NUW58_g2716 [Xylaria curta]